MSDWLSEKKQPSRPGILLVDDIAANLTAMEAMLEGLNADVVSVSSGKEALAKLIDRDFAMVLMDVRMPEMDGLETAQMIRKRDKTLGLPIIFLTAYDDSADLSARAYALGAVDFLVKPIVSTVLLSKINAFLTQYDLRQELIRQHEELQALRSRQEAERERARELRSYEHFRALSEDAECDIPLRPSRIDEGLLKGLTESYRTIVRQYVLAVRVQDSRPRAQVKALATQLAEHKASARHVVKLHLGILDDLTEGAMAADRQKVANDARLVLVELLGNLLDLYRATSSDKGGEGYPFTISETGISILPLSAVQLRQESSNERLITGNAELDRITNGGIFKDSVFLISGPTGSGKTLLSTIFADEGCRNKEKVLLLAYEESREQLLRNAHSWGMNFQSWEEQGLLKIVCQYPEAMGLEDHLLRIRREIEAFRPNRMVMDSVSAMERVATVRNFREFVIGLTSFVKQERVCSLMTSTTPQLSGGESVTETHISTITDIIALLRYVEICGELRRGLAVIKMRGSQHDKTVHEYVIDGNGLNVSGRFKNIENILLGLPKVSVPSESEQLEGMFKAD